MSNVKVTDETPASALTGVEPVRIVQGGVSVRTTTGDIAGLVSVLDRSPNAQTGTTYTLQESDNGILVTLDNTSPITVTVPTGFADDFACTIEQINTGAVTVDDAPGVTLHAPNGLTLAGQYAAATIIREAATDTFNVSGNMSAAGPTGPTGPTGPVGSTGPTGPTGATGKVAQVVTTLFATKGTTSASIPADDSIPQSGEGVELFTCSITPTNASSTLVFEVVIIGSNSTAGATLSVALFKDSGADAIASAFVSIPILNLMMQAVVTHSQAAGSTSAQTYKVRVGTNTGTMTYNGANNTRFYGGTIQSTIVITEVTP